MPKEYLDFGSSKLHQQGCLVFGIVKRVFFIFFDTLHLPPVAAAAAASVTVAVVVLVRFAKKLLAGRIHWSVPRLILGSLHQRTFSIKFTSLPNCLAC